MEKNNKKSSHSLAERNYYSRWHGISQLNTTFRYLLDALLVLVSRVLLKDDEQAHRLDGQQRELRRESEGDSRGGADSNQVLELYPGR